MAAKDSESKSPKVEAAEVKHLEALAAFHAAQTKKAEDEASVARAEARLKNAEASEAEIELEARREKRERELTGDSFFHKYPFSTPVSSQSVQACIKQLNEWTRNAGDDKFAIEIEFNSPGGSVIDGMALYDVIQAVRRLGHHVTTSTVGYAASMGGILLQAGDKRVMGAQSWLMIHEASFGAGGKIGEVEDTVDWVRRVQERILEIFASRSQGTSAPKKLTKAQIRNRWRRKDWWISSDEALAFGLIDEVW